MHIAQCTNVRNAPPVLQQSPPNFSLATLVPVIYYLAGLVHDCHSLLLFTGKLWQT